MTIRGTIGGHRKTRIYGRLDCPSALRAIANGGYVTHRVFFADEAAAIAAGFRPCARCMPERYKEWKASAFSGDAEPSHCRAT
jgi:methylphosphotriester-DNA--protein-cysteine methyltransferase